MTGLRGSNQGRTLNHRSLIPHRIFMDLQLEGKHALITGSSAGIGYAIAERLALEGASVIVNGRTQQRVDQALAALARSGARGPAAGLAADLGTAEGVQQAVEQFP